MIKYHRWTKCEDDFLISNFEWIGDYRLAEMFNSQFPKHYPWTNKHIEKRRSYLKIKRSKEQEYTLRYLQCLCSDKVKSWDKRGRSPDGSVKNWYGGKRQFIKIDNVYKDLKRHAYENSNKTKIPDRHILRDGKILSRSDHAIINTTQRKGKKYPFALLETKILTFKLKKLTDGKEN